LEALEWLHSVVYLELWWFKNWRNLGINYCKFF